MVEAIGPAQLRRLRQGDEQSCFAEREPARLLAEIGERGGPDPFEIAAVRGEREVEVEDLVLAQNALELNGADCLPELDVKRALAPRLSRRATCMVMVEPPETICPCVTNCSAARAKASGSTP